MLVCHELQMIIIGIIVRTALPLITELWNLFLNGPSSEKHDLQTLKVPTYHLFKRNIELLVNYFA